MKYLIILYLFAAMLLTRTAVAGDIDDIKKTTMEHIAMQNAGDAAGHIAHHMSYHTQFINGEFLSVKDSREEQIKSLQSLFDSGIKFNFDISHLEVKVYGKAAVVTGYIVGNMTNPNGTISEIRSQRTAVLIKEGNDWKEVHVHSSPLTAAE